MAELTPKQSMFVKEYLVDLNATQAAIRAGYSAKTAGSVGNENLQKPEIATAIQAAMDKRSQKTEITAEYVLTGIKNVTERCADEGDNHNPQAALKGYELLGKHLKLFTDKIEVDVTEDVAAMIAERRKRIGAA
jgi:phage terminase small subunit